MTVINASCNKKLLRPQHCTALKQPDDGGLLILMSHQGTLLLQIKKNLCFLVFFLPCVFNLVVMR